MWRTQLLTLQTLLLLWPLTACANNEPAALSAAPPSQDSERLSAEVPEHWQKIVDRKVGDLHMVEYYPPGADEDWEQKLTIESLAGKDLPDPLVYAAGLAEEQQGLCEDFKDNAVFAGFENGYPTTVHVLECGQSKRTGRSVVTMVKIIQGNKSLYTISRYLEVTCAG